MKLFLPFLPFILVCSLLVSCKNEELYVASDIKINELMSNNLETASDAEGDYDDWIELYNNGNLPVDLTGYYLTDNHNNFRKWEFPAGTRIAAKGYLIVWADDELTQVGLHANFKLSSQGEELLLITPGLKIADYVTFGAQPSEESFSRIPNGTGSFSWQYPTFNGPNVQSLPVSK